MTGFGTPLAAIRAGSASGSGNQVESWDGSSWTETTEINTGRYALSSAGRSNNGLVFGGDGPDANTERWNGSAWPEVGDLSTGRYGPGGSMNSSVATLASGGYTTTAVTTTEEFTADIANSTVTTS